MHFVRLECRSKIEILGYILSFNMLALSSQAFSAESLTEFGEVLMLNQAEQIALQEEPGIVGQHWLMQSLSEQAIADGQLMDPKLQLSLGNIPTDSFDFDQENMTQFKVGIIQNFPPGDTLNIKRQKKQMQSELLLYLRTRLD